MCLSCLTIEPNYEATYHMISVLLAWGIYLIVPVGILSGDGYCPHRLLIILLVDDISLTLSG